ncbi:MAG: isoaspartyl peptidase/L-asparaginase [Salibacteraceae bacterium]
MKSILPILLISVLTTLQPLQSQPFGLAIHGGAGSMQRSNMTLERISAYENALESALNEGYALLEKGAPAEEAVIMVIMSLENNPLFNCGKGSVLNAKGKVEMDASIMLGKNLDAGAVSGVRKVRNPIMAADEVRKNSPHVMMSNKGADRFAKSQGLKMEHPTYFKTKKSKEALKRAKQREKAKVNEDEKHGTVGCVALDKFGNLAAGTSTGGMTNKMYNRIGDSPIIGAGTYANNQSCAVSCTGHGEYFIRLGVAKEVSSLMQYERYDVDKASRIVIHQQLEKLGGKGGLIAIDRKGNISMPFNTSGMFRGYMLSSGDKNVLIFEE